MLSSSNQDVRPQPEKLNLIFKALGDQTRRKLLQRLSTRPAIVTELAKQFDMSLPAVGKHIRVLEKAGLITRTITGRVHNCSINAQALQDAATWLKYYEQFWNDNLDSLIEHMQQDGGPE